MSLRAKGSKVEREVQKILWDMGFKVVRVARSGSSLYPMPDLVAIINNVSKVSGFEIPLVYAIEIKNLERDCIYLSELKDLFDFSYNGCNVIIPSLIWKRNRKGIYWLRPVPDNYMAKRGLTKVTWKHMISHAQKLK